MTTNPSPTLKEKIRHELKSFFIIFLYVWIIIGLFALQKALVLNLSPLSGQISALLKALVLAKFILTFELLKFAEVYRSKAPVIRIVIKAAIYGVLLMALSVVEEGVKACIHGKSFEEGIAEVGNGRLEGMMVLALITSVALIPYLVCKELIRVMGQEKIVAIVFRDPVAESA